MSANRASSTTLAMDSTETTRLPPALICKRTGLAAGIEDGCGTCDACLWVSAMEAEFAEEEEEPDD